MDDEAAHLDAPRLDRLAVDAVVAGERVSEDEDLTGEGWVGEHFLVPGHRRREDDLPVGASGGAEGLAFEGGAVLEDEEGLSDHQTPPFRCKLWRSPVRAASAPRAACS